MFDEIAKTITSYLERGEVFAVAQVIHRQAPSSGKVGDKAIILSSGELIGWIGGGCVKGIVIKEALLAIGQNSHRLVRVAPAASSPAGEEFTVYKMTCHSEGSVDILIEPITPYPRLIILGKSNIAQNLLRIALTCHFPVSVMAEEARMIFSDLGGGESVDIKEKILFDEKKSYQKSYIVIATQGEGDEDAVHKALLTDALYVGFVASKKKASRVKEYLLKQGVPKERVEMLKSPVGIDIHAKGHSEVAISILAEIIADFRGTQTPAKDASQDMSSLNALANGDGFSEEFYINPVCQVPVSKKNPKHVIDHKGEKIYFCCDGCKITFEENPEKYVKA